MFPTHSLLPVRPASAIVAVILFVVPVFADNSTDQIRLLERGRSLYQSGCADCHGDKGQGVTGAFESTLAGDLTVDGLAQVIHATMPEGSPDDCVDEDAAAVAAWIHQEFYGEAAQMRINPPRRMLAHLTAEQLRQSLSDLYAAHMGLARPGSERGLNAKYFDAANFNGKTKKIERVDAGIDFDFAHEGPGGEIAPEEYSIHWHGALLTEQTGPYEIIIRSTCSFTCQLGDYGTMFIDNHVQSGDQTEFRKSLQLTGGRITPLQIHFRQRKRKTEQPPGRISLAWVPPGGTEQIIPTRHLLPTGVPPAFHLQTWLPPDDRSYGFERGISVDREWDDSTTQAALEFADAAADKPWQRWQKKHKDAPDENRSVLRSFLTEIAQTAFRGPLDEATQSLYIESQISDDNSDRETIRQVLLAVLKSPRFLYPSLNQDSPLSYQQASRLALILHDSLPTESWLQERIAAETVQTPEQIRELAARMIQDARTQAKMRQLMSEWLNLRDLQDVSKNDERYPGFTPQVISELRDSLTVFLDSVIWSEHSDYRKLFQGRAPIETSLLQDFYQRPAGDADNSATVPKIPDAGVLTHPYLMAALSYRDSTSPIHRGVFLIRYVLGRTIRPPADANFKPLSADLHPDLTTRERVHLQTSPDSCQVCHRKINGLGFVLENFDPVGRYRSQDQTQNVDSTGYYTTRTGAEVRFDGPLELAEFVASSDDAHRAFVERMFLHFVKQPPGAWGPETLPQLTRFFREHDYNMRQLLIEIASVAATPR